jgi:hypothetical protein
MISQFRITVKEVHISNDCDTFHHWNEASLAYGELQNTFHHSNE